MSDEIEAAAELVMADDREFDGGTTRLAAIRVAKWARERLAAERAEREGRERIVARLRDTALSLKQTSDSGDCGFMIDEDVKELLALLDLLAALGVERKGGV